MEKAVSDSWGEIWQTDLDRSFTGDFEEYRNADPENCDIDIYIALK
jgi:predicted transcriptional regulator YdeE